VGSLVDHESAPVWWLPCPTGEVGTDPGGVLGSPVLRRPDDDHPGRADDMPLTIYDLPDASRPVMTWPPAPVP
jgi:hypothetical protein